MANNHNDIYSIVEKLRVLEEGLDKNQKSVNQLSATFKPKTVAVLTAKTDPKNPMAGKLVGGCEESEELEEAVANEEKLLDKVKKSLTDYLSSIENKYKDQDLKDKKKDDRDLGTKDKTDRDLVAKEDTVTLATDDADDEPWHGVTDPEFLKDLIADAQVMDYDEFYDEYSRYFDDPEEFWSEYHTQDDDLDETDAIVGLPVVSVKEESHPVKTLTNECGLWEMHGNEHDGFEIRRGGRVLPSRFKNLDEAEMAVEMFLASRQHNDDSADYLEEK